MNVYEQSNLLELSARIEGREISWREKLALLSSEVAEHAQIECPVEHVFADGKYVRRIHIPKGTLFIGRPHRRGHLCRLEAGSLIQFVEGAKIERHPGDSLQTVPGYQVVLYSLSDVIGATVHTDNGERDIEKLEAEIFEPKTWFTELGVSVKRALEKAA
jgi:hypothetical protein